MYEMLPPCSCPLATMLFATIFPFFMSRQNCGTNFTLRMRMFLTSAYSPLPELDSLKYSANEDEVLMFGVTKK